MADETVGTVKLSTLDRETIREAVSAMAPMTDSEIDQLVSVIKNSIRHRVEEGLTP